MAAPRSKSPTIADVARVAGVSLPTVSRVLTGSTPVRAATRDRVVAAIRELSYRPNGAARALVRGRQPIVGVIARDTSAYGRARMLASIEERARAAEYVVAVTILDPADVASVPTALEVLLSQPIVGVVVLDYNTYDEATLRPRLGTIPIATVTSGADGGIDVPHVVIDDRSAARAMTEYLLSLGHRTVHHVAVPGINGRLHARELGWREALDAAGREAPEPRRTDWTIESARAAGASLAAQSDVTAVFCSNDQIAFGVMRSLYERGRRVPEDVSVAAIDNEPLAGAWVPSLTTYHLDWDWAGEAAFALLMGAEPGVLNPVGDARGGLILRESSGPPRT